MWSPPDPYEPTSELYRIMPSRRRSQLREALDAAHGIDDPASDDPVVLISPDLPRWRALAARARPASRWAWGLATATLGATIGGVLSLLIYASLSGH
jgi:hypothetical protein